MESSNNEHKVRDSEHWFWWQVISISSTTSRMLVCHQHCTWVLWIPGQSFVITTLIFQTFQFGRRYLTMVYFSSIMQKKRCKAEIWKPRLIIYLEQIHMKDLAHLIEGHYPRTVRRCSPRSSGEPWKGNQYWQFQDIWEFDDLKYENITNVFRITNGYEGQGSSDSTGLRNQPAVHESLTKKDNRLLLGDTSIFQKKCNRKLLTSILIFIKVTHRELTFVTHFRHQHPSQINVANIWLILF